MEDVAAGITNLKIIAQITGGLYLTHQEVNELIDFYNGKAVTSDRKAQRYREIQQHLTDLAKGKITQEAQNGQPAPVVKALNSKPKTQGYKIRISRDVAMEIREKYKSGDSMSYLGAVYKVSDNTVRAILQTTGRYRILLEGEQPLTKRKGRTPGTGSMDAEYERDLVERYEENGAETPNPFFP